MILRCIISRNLGWAAWILWFCVAFAHAGNAGVIALSGPNEVSLEGETAIYTVTGRGNCNLNISLTNLQRGTTDYLYYFQPHDFEVSPEFKFALGNAEPRFLGYIGARLPATMQITVLGQPNMSDCGGRVRKTVRVERR